MSGLHHQHLRKRAALAKYPHPKAGMRFLDKVVLVAGVISPVMTVPQLWQIYTTFDASGVSALSWGAYAVLDIPFIMYGVAHRAPPLIVTYSLWLVMNAAVAVGAIMYG